METCKTIETEQVLLMLNIKLQWVVSVVLLANLPVTYTIHGEAVVKVFESVLFVRIYDGS